MTTTTATTMNNRNKRATQESPFQKFLKEVERTLCFTDVPCGAMEYQDVLKKSTPIESSFKSNNEKATHWMKRLECALCFSDLKDMKEPGRPSKRVCLFT